MPDPRLVPTIRERIKRCDYQAVFAHGECFRFALRLNERFGYKIRGVKSHLRPNQMTWSHVWALKDQKAIDIYGVHEERLLAALSGHEGDAVFDIGPDEVRALIHEKDYPSDLGRELDELADLIVDTHERFLMARPVNPEIQAAFLADLKKAANQSAQTTPGS